MVNLTLSIEKEVLRRARIRALQEDTSVNELVRRMLAEYAAPERAAAARDALVRLSESVSSGSGGRSWTRDSLHERD